MHSRPVSTFDWPRLLDDLAYCLGERPAEGSGMVQQPCSNQALADALGVPRGTLRNCMAGAEPKHADGEVILQRWCTLTGRSRMFAPTIRRPFSAATVRAG